MQQGGGPGLKRAIHVGRVRAGITSDLQLAQRAGVSYDTLMNWYAERTTPRGAEMKRVASAIGLRLADLEAAYEGIDPEPPPLTEAIAEQTAQITALVESVRELVAFLRGPRSPEDPIVGRARAAWSEAEAAYEKERARSTSGRRSSDPDGPAKGRRRAGPAAAAG